VTERLHWEHRAGGPWLVLSGEIDYWVADSVSDTLLEARYEPGGLDVDLSRVVFIDSTGLALLVRLRHVFGEVRIHAVPDTVAHLLAMTGLADVFTSADLAERDGPASVTAG
jgi:anti-sigma B factor antagonist